MFKKEVDRLLILGMSEHANDFKWVAPYFLQPKTKTNWVRFLSDSWNLNMQLKSKLYPILKISEILLKLEGFRYATSLDLNMGYYHIRLRTETSNLCTIFLPYRNYRYKHLPVGVRNSQVNLQEKSAECSMDLNKSNRTSTTC